MASFKQQCPSCEALVPIRDDGLIGRKIDCPKCKYRFLVEEPPEEVDPDDEAAEPSAKTKPVAGKDKVTDKKPGDKKVVGAKGKGKADDKTKPGPRNSDDDEEDDKSPKKKKKGVNVLVLGGSIAGASILLLGLALYFILWGGSSTPDTPKQNPNPGPVGIKDPPKPKDKEPEKPKDEIPLPPPPQELFVADISNLLPNDTQVIMPVAVDALLKSSVKQAMLRTFS